MSLDASDAAVRERRWQQFRKLAIIDGCVWVVAVVLTLTVTGPDPAAERVGDMVGALESTARWGVVLAHIAWTVTAAVVHKDLMARGLTESAPSGMAVASVALFFLAGPYAALYTRWALKRDASQAAAFDEVTGQMMSPGPVSQPPLDKPLAVGAIAVALVAAVIGVSASKVSAYAADTYTWRDRAERAVNTLSDELVSIAGAVTVAEDADAAAQLEKANDDLEAARDLLNKASFFSAEGYKKAAELAEEGSRMVSDLAAFVSDRDEAASRIEEAKTALAKAKTAADPGSQEAKEYAAAYDSYQAAVAAFGKGLFSDRENFGKAMTQAGEALAGANEINTRVADAFAAAENAGSIWACYVAYLRFYTDYPNTAEAKDALESAMNLAAEAVKSDMDTMRDVLKHNAAWAKDPMDFQREGWVELPTMVEDEVVDRYKSCKNSIKSNKRTRELCRLNSALYEAAWAGNQFKKVIKRLEDESTVSGDTITYYYDSAMQRQMNGLCDIMRTNLNTAKDVLNRL